MVETFYLRYVENIYIHRREGGGGGSSCANTLNVPEYLNSELYAIPCNIIT